MPWQKRIADALTLTRVPLALGVVWLGADQGRGGLYSAWLLLLLTATIDTLDGFFARLSPRLVKTWIGSHDLSFDLIFSTALLGYLVLAEVVSLALAALYLGGWALLMLTTHGSASVRAVIFQGPIYLITVLAAAMQAPRILLWTALWLAVMGLFTGRRFLSVRLPVLLHEFAQSVRGVSQRRKKSG